MGWERAHFDVLMAGVDIFFVISGFIMWVTTAARPERTAVHFLRDRLQRIGPAYWILTAAIVVALAVAPGAIRPASVSPDFVLGDHLWHVISSFLFVASQHPIKGDFQPVLTAGWTLNLEMFFYLIFAAAMALCGSNLLRRALLLVFSLTGIALIGFLAGPSGALAFYTQDLLLEFVGGVLLGIAYSRGWIRASRLWWIALAAGWGGLAYAIEPIGLPRSLAWGLPALLIVAGTVFAPAMSGWFLQKLGDSSYSLYITHQITLAVAATAWMLAKLPVNMTFPLVAVAFSIVAAWLFYALVERPLTRYFQKAAIRPVKPSGQNRAVSKARGAVPAVNEAQPGQVSLAYSDGHRHV